MRCLETCHLMKKYFHQTILIDNLLNLQIFCIIIVFKNGDRLHRIGGDLIQIPAKVVTQIIDWNRNKRDEVKLDSKIFGSLLLCLASPENLREGLVNDCVMNFIQSIFCIQSKNEGHDLIFPYCFILGCFEVRCRNAVDRISAIHSFKTDILEKIRKMEQIVQS